MKKSWKWRTVKGAGVTQSFMRYSIYVGVWNWEVRRHHVFLNFLPAASVEISFG